jgi:hypothetical protein
MKFKNLKKVMKYLNLVILNSNMEERPDFEKDKKVTFRIKRSGMFQRIIFTMVEQPSPAGPYTLLITDLQMDLSEIARLSNEINYPIKAKNGTVFPRGKSLMNFLIK